MFKKIVLSTALLLSASVAFAADEGVYVGIDTGSTKFDGISGRQTSFGGFAGFQFAKELAVEVAYRRLGSVTMMGADVDTKQTAVSVVGSYNVAKDFDLFARAGYNQLSATASYAGRSGSASDHGSLYGLGASYRFTENVSARVEWQLPARDTNNFGAALVIKF